MELARLIITILAAILVISCIALRFNKKYRFVSGFLEIIALVLFVVLAITALTSSPFDTSSFTSWSQLVMLVALCAYLVYRMMSRK